MRRSALHLISGLIGGILIASAAAPVASVTAPGPIRISGAEVPATAAASTPVGPGDEIATTTSPALIRFGLKGVIALEKSSAVKIEPGPNGIAVCLLSGSYRYKFQPASNLVVCKAGAPLATSLEGSVSMDTRGTIALSPERGPAIVAGVASPKSKNCPPSSNGINCR